MEVQVIDMMRCRERRAGVQSALIERYGCPVVSFCMNIPGPVKTSETIRRAFEQGKDELFRQLAKKDIEVLCTEEFHEATGDELLLAAEGNASVIKELATAIEETHPFGRLFDMDVIDKNGRKLSRGSYRKCILCDCQAQECARSRRHTLQELQQRVNELLREGC